MFFSFIYFQKKHLEPASMIIIASEMYLGYRQTSATIPSKILDEGLMHLCTFYLMQLQKPLVSFSHTVWVKLTILKKEYLEQI